MVRTIHSIVYYTSICVSIPIGDAEIALRVRCLISTRGHSGLKVSKEVRLELRALARSYLPPKLTGGSDSIQKVHKLQGWRQFQAFSICSATVALQVSPYRVLLGRDRPGRSSSVRAICTHIVWPSKLLQ